MRVKTRFFVILSTVVLMSLLITSAIAISAFSTAMVNEIIKHAEDTMSFLNADISSATTNRLLEFESHVKNIGLENNFKYYVSNFSLTDDNNAILLLSSLNNGLQNIFSSISIYDAKGLKLASLNNSNNWFDFGPDISTEDIFRNSIKGNSFHDMHLLYSPLLRDYFVVLSAPVYGLEANDIHTKSNNKIEGIVVASYPVSALLEDILSNYIIKENNLYLLSNDGTVIYSTHINQSKTHISISNPSNQIIGLKLTDEPIYNQIAASTGLVESGIYPPVDNSDSGNSLYVAVKDVTNKDTESHNLNGNNGNLFYDFILISELDVGTAFKDMFNLRGAFVITTFVIFIGVTIAALRASKSITKPLIRLKDSAISITKGNLNDVIHPTSDDEIGELATQFEKMRQSITQYIDHILKKDKELEKANKELIEVEYKKDEFITMVSHELKTPLVPIKGYAEMLLKPRLLGELNEKQLKAIQSIYRNVKKQELLVDDVLDVYKLELGKLNLVKKEVKISDILTNVINDTKSITEEKRVSIVTEINTKSRNTIYCDGQRIEQVLLNLMRNSLDFIPENGGKIIISIDEKHLSNHVNPTNNDIDPYFIFAVKDNGEGIADDKINSLFNKFYQVDSSKTRKHGGTGLGLVICKGIVEAHGGRIWVKSDSKIGTSVIFALPKLNFDPITIS